jgi:hypothetical protein
VEKDILIGANGWNTMKSQTIVANRTMKSFVVTMLNIRKDFIQCMEILGVVHFEDMYNHHVDYLCLSIVLGT